MNARTLLLVDDDSDDLMILEESIRAINDKFKFVTARDGMQALNYLKSIQHKDQFPSLIILDINMPVLDGRELLPLLKNDNVYKDIPVVVFTTSSNPSDKAVCIEYGVDMITKPFDMAQLMVKARELISYCT